MVSDVTTTQTYTHTPEDAAYKTCGDDQLKGLESLDRDTYARYLKERRLAKQPPMSEAEWNAFLHIGPGSFSRCVVKEARRIQKAMEETARILRGGGGYAGDRTGPRPVFAVISGQTYIGYAY